MRKLILAMQVSLDGFVEGENGDMSWTQTNDHQQWDDLFEMLESVDLFLLGRKMFPDYRNYWIKALGKTGFSENEVKYAQFAEKTPHIVFSQTLKDPQWHNTTVTNKPVVEEVRRIKQLPGKDIQIVGGAMLAATLIDSGLVDEYRFTINPTIVTKGKSFFEQLNQRRNLVLTGLKNLASGVIILKYEP